MKILPALVLFLLVSFSLFAQEPDNRWKPLTINDKEKIWYDAASVDSIKGDHFDVWILQMHKPPLVFDGIKGDIYRSKTLYTINLKTVKYGLKQVIYYNVSNKEITRFSYNIDSYPENLKYTYPIYDTSFLYKFLQELFKKNGTATNQ